MDKTMVGGLGQKLNLSETALCLMHMLAVDERVLCPTAPEWVHDAYREMKQYQLVDLCGARMFHNDGVGYALSRAFELTQTGRIVHRELRDRCKLAMGAYSAHLPLRGDVQTFLTKIQTCKHFNFVLNGECEDMTHAIPLTKLKAHGAP
jgi:hypothetical protein